MVALNQSKIDSSIASAPSMLSGLNEEQQTRLTGLLDDYLCGLENGEPLDLDQIRSDHADVSYVFDAYVEKLQTLYGIASDFSTGESVLSVAKGELSQLGDFTLHRQIGRGGMGIVYEATQESLGRQVAVKILPPTSHLDAKQVARFRNEAQIAGSLSHPNIVPVHSVGSENGIHYFAMSRISGASVDVWLQQKRSATEAMESAGTESPRDHAQPQALWSPETNWQSIVRWIIDIADALHAAHEAGIVHRDVKPSNLIVDRGEKIWITDFGLARCQSNADLTASGDFVGTMRYMSPEQASGKSALVDGRTDIYSLAATAYEMLTLSPVHTGDDAATILNTINGQDAVPLRKRCPALPRDLETVIAKALDKHRDRRYETARDFADDMRRVLNGEPTFARPPTIADRVTRQASRYRTAVLVAAGVGLLGFIGFAISTAMIAGAKKQSDFHADRATRNEQLAHGAVDRLGAQMAELLADVPSAAPVRRALLLETLAYYETFAASAIDDPDLAEDLAVTYGKIGHIQNELGSKEKAVVALTQSEALYANLASNSNRLLLDWSVSQNNLAQALAEAGSLEEAARYFGRAIKTQRGILQQSAQLTPVPDTHLADSATRQLATTLNNLGLLLAASQAFDEAESAYGEAIELLRNAEHTSDGPEIGHELAAVLSNLGGLLVQRSPQRSVKFAREAIAKQTSILESDPTNTRLASQAISSLNTLGAAQLADGQLAEAVSTFRQSIRLTDKFLARWPDHTTHVRDQVVAHNQLGLTLAKMAKLSEAEESFLSALRYSHDLIAHFPSDAEVQSMHGNVLNNLGFVEKQLGQPQAASTRFAEAVQAQQRAVELAPEVERYQVFLRKHRQNRHHLSSLSTQGMGS